MESLLIAIIVPIVLPIVFGFFYRKKDKEEAKLNTNGKYIVRVTSSIRHFFLGWMILCLLGSLIIPIMCIVDKANTTVYIVLIASGVILFFFLLGFLGYAISKWNYLIVEENRIIKVKGFKKDIIEINRIKYISSFDVGFGSLIAYDENYVPLFEIDGSFVGITNLKADLSSMNLKSITRNDIDATNPEYKKYKKQNNIKIWKYVLIGFALAGLALYGLIKPQIRVEDFNDYSKSVVVENFTKKEELLLFHFEGDDKEYIVSNIVYKKLNQSIYDVLKNGTEMNIVLYNNESAYISQIEINGKIYLNKDEAKELEINNYNSSIVFTNVLLVASISMITIGMILFFYQLYESKKHNSHEITI